MADPTNTNAPAPVAAPTDSPPTSAPSEVAPSPQPSEAASVASEGSQEASKPFDMAAWKAAGGSRSELPENMRSLYDHLSDDFTKRDSFNAVKELQNLISDADQRAGVGQQRQGVYDNQQQPQEQADVEKQVQARMAQMKNQEAVTKFRGDFESMLKQPISVGDGHTFAFADKNELGKFVEYSRNVLNNGAISPQDLYKLWNFERILADTGEWKARQHEETLRKAATGVRSAEQSGTQATSKKEERSAGEQRGNQTVEEIMQEKFPEIYGNMKSGNVRYG